MTMATSYSIGKHFEGFIERLIESGRYSTASEVIRDGLRLIEEREQSREAKLEWLRAAIQEGLDSPVEEVDIDEWIEDVKRRGRQRLAAAAGIDGEQDTPAKAG
jgi:antitoxin ParD1/3/4